MRFTKVVFMLNTRSSDTRHMISERVASIDVDSAVARAKELKKEQNVDVRSFFFAEVDDEYEQVTPNYFLGGEALLLKDLDVSKLSNGGSAMLTQYMSEGKDRLFKTKGSDLLFLMEADDITIEDTEN